MRTTAFIVVLSSRWRKTAVKAGTLGDFTDRTQVHDHDSKMHAPRPLPNRKAIAAAVVRTRPGAGSGGRLVVIQLQVLEAAVAFEREELLEMEE